MAFVKAKHPSIEGYLRNLQQNVFVPFHTVHDEIDYIIDSNLLPGIMKRLSEFVACKKIFDIIGPGFIDYLADCEFDKENNSWIPSGSYDIYKCPRSIGEAEAIERYKQSEDSLKAAFEGVERQEKVEETVIELTMEAKDKSEFIRLVPKDDSGVLVVLNIKGVKYKSKHRYNRSEVMRFKSNLEQVEEL